MAISSSTDMFTTISSTMHHVGHKIVSILGNRTTAGNILRVYNVVTAAAVFANYMTNRNASSSEYLFDVAVHGLQASVSDNSPQFLKLAAAYMNIIRISFIGNNVIRKTSTIPTNANIIDVLNHGLNLAYLSTS